MKVGSSKVLKTNVRIIAATNVDIPKAIERNKFREDLYYRLNTVPIQILPLRQRREDIILLFRKFARDFAEKYRMPAISLDDESRNMLMSYYWPGNIRQLKNITEQISIIEQKREIDAPVLKPYLPVEAGSNLPAVFHGSSEKSFSSEREILYQVLFDMKKDMNDLKKLVLDLMDERDGGTAGSDHSGIIRKLYRADDLGFIPGEPASKPIHIDPIDKHHIQDTEEFVEESLSLEGKEIELITKALEKHKGKRKYAAQELGISERTLYRKIKEYDIKK
jgi:DNA-binding NtrC family response regulator